MKTDYKPVSVAKGVDFKSADGADNGFPPHLPRSVVDRPQAAGTIEVGA
jgi:hypothetical protein